MLKNVWNTALVNPMFNLLVALYLLTGNNMGWAIILLTLVIRAILVPFSIPSLKSMKKQREIQPQIKKLKEKYKHSKEELAKKQMELFKEHGINPASGCLTQISTIVVIVALYNVIRKFSGGVDAVASLNGLIYFDNFKFVADAVINTNFLYLDLAKPDPYYILPVLAGIFQFFSSKLMKVNVSVGEEKAKETPDKKDDLAYNMQEQMLYLMPIMTVFIGAKLPAGATLYIVTTTIFSLVQNYVVQNFDDIKRFLGIKKDGKKDN